MPDQARHDGVGYLVARLISSRFIPLRLITGNWHGEAVAVGMVMAARISKEKGLIDNSGLKRLIRLIEKDFHETVSR